MSIGKTLAPCAAAAALLLNFTLAAPDAAAGEGKSAGDIMVRGRVIGVLPDEESSLTLNGAGIGDKAEVGNRWTGEIDGSYFITDNIALELIAATTKHTVKSNGTTLGNFDLGSVGLLPPTLTAQYHFMPKSAFSPYLGAGVTYAIFYNEKPGAADSIHYDNAWGFALQAGIDYNISGNWYLNADVKKIFISTDVTAGAGANTAKADVDLDPWVVGFGVGYKF
ncbi:MAG TPA: OmpW family outer membrane protein [Ferrovibrio sp.]|jgi:outer membrane protein|uniref:OmpW/AlkL family protein n=1 Tax=Ferrovibrio sp. TaxID=1917215 RepID=UPI002ED4E10C